MPEGFVSLEHWLRSSSGPVEPRSEYAPVAPDAPDAPDESIRTSSELEELEYEVCARVRRFRAMLDEALDRHVHELLQEIAVAVLGRELQLAPADLSAIVRSASRRIAPEEPVAIHVHPAEVEYCSVGLPVLGDDRMRRGDVEIHLKSGSIDARLGVRLEQLLDRVP
jgi:flagellar biosynthesis/type III secretory pathway protein FliH